MSALLAVCRIRHLTIAATLGLALPVSALGLETRVIEIFPDHYVAGGWRLRDAAALEAWAQPDGGRPLWIHSCGQVPSGQLAAAIERLRAAQIKDIHVRMLAGDDPECVTARADGAFHVRAADSEYLVIDAHGRSTIP